MNIYEKTIEAVRQGARFRVDLKRRTLKVNGETIIEDGDYEGELGLRYYALDEVLEEVEHRYVRYKNSIPSERSDSRRRNYFMAEKMDDITEEDMMYGEPREVTQAELEVFILICILNGSFVWDEPMLGKWFWQSSFDKDLVILKEWIVGE